MNDREIVIGLYREGMPAKLIKAKMEITTAQYREYLEGEPQRAQKPRTTPKRSGYRITRPESPAKREAMRLLREGKSVAQVVERLSHMGLSAHESSVARWRMDARGPVNCRVPVSLYPVLKSIIAENPAAHGTQVAQLYNKATGLRLDRRAAQHWVRKERAAA